MTWLDPKINKAKLMEFLIDHKKDLAWYNQELIKYQRWYLTKYRGKPRSAMGHGVSLIREWLPRAIKYQEESNGVSGGVLAVFPNGPDSGGGSELGAKIAAYRNFQARGMGEWYLNQQPERVRRAILERDS